MEPTPAPRPVPSCGQAPADRCDAGRCRDGAGRVKLATVAALALLVALASACSRAGADTSAPRPAVVYGFESTAGTNDAAVTAGRADLHRLVDETARREGTITVRRFGGSPDELSTPVSATLAPEGPNDLFRKANQRKLVQDADQKLGAELRTGSSADADVFGSLATLARDAHDAGPADHRLLVVRTRGVHKTGWANLVTTELTPAKIAEVISWVDERGLAPDLAGTDVVIVGVGTGDDSAISASRREQYASLMRAWCERGHARSCAVTPDLPALP